MPKFIFVTGGVVSSVGKGIIASSVGRILTDRGLRVAIQKLDPYLNVDPGTMSPYQHGEVFVTADGAETDLDLGHYERFIGRDLPRECSVSSGQIYQTVLGRERSGDFLGGTIQVVPHVTAEIKRRIRLAASTAEAEILIVEIGGTVGDIESQPYLEAVRQLRHELPAEATLVVHVTFLPYIGATRELKTKPTQHSVRELRSLGVQPDLIVCRADQPIADVLLEKVAQFCDVPQAGVIPMPTSRNIYAVPAILEQAAMGAVVLRHLQLPGIRRTDSTAWRDLAARIGSERGDRLYLAIVGKYVGLHDAYLSVKEALAHAAAASGVHLSLRWIDAEQVDPADVVGSLRDLNLADVSGIIVPGGFGARGIPGMLAVARYARLSGIPYFGLCLGMQVMAIECAQAELDARAHSTEFESSTPWPVIDLLPDQLRGVTSGGTMRLGNYDCALVRGSLAHAAYGAATLVTERHRHRYEVNPAYTNLFRTPPFSLRIGGQNPETGLIEILEHRTHPWMLGTQFHPEFRSRPDAPHPLFESFLAAALAARRTTCAA